MIQAIAKPSSRRQKSLFPPLLQDDDALRRQSLPGVTSLCRDGRMRHLCLPTGIRAGALFSADPVKALGRGAGC
jgi:hypothetical protein